MELQICSKLSKRKLELASQLYNLEDIKLYKNSSSRISGFRIEKIEGIFIYDKFKLDQLLILRKANGFLFFKLHELENLRFTRTCLVLSISGKRYKLKFNSSVFGVIAHIKAKLLLARIGTNFYANPSHIYQFYKKLDPIQ